MTIVNMTVEHNCLRGDKLPNVFMDCLTAPCEDMISCEVEKKVTRVLVCLVQVALIKMAIAVEATAKCSSKIEDAEKFLREFGIELELR